MRGWDDGAAEAEAPRPPGRDSRRALDRIFRWCLTMAWIGRTTWVLAGATAAALAYATLIEPRWLKTVRRRVSIPGLPGGLEGLRVGLITDPHAGPLTPRSVIRRAAHRLTVARPDLIALTGDLADRGPADVARALDALGPLRAPLGVYTVPGNHDHAVAGIGAWREAIHAHPVIQDLSNRFVVLERGGARLCVAGVEDLEEGRPELRLPPRKERGPTLVLAHQPDHARHLGGDVDLVLAGHTHGGQVRLPFVGPLRRKSAIHDEGLDREDGPPVYTSRGIGTTFLPLRFGARPEVVVLELTARRDPDGPGAAG